MSLKCFTDSTNKSSPAIVPADLHCNTCMKRKKLLLFPVWFFSFIIKGGKHAYTIPLL